MPTVLLILKDLAENGLVKKSGTLESSGGRKPAVISLAYDAKLSVGIEITQNHLRFVLIDLNENVLHDKKVREPFRNDDTYFRQIGAYLKAFLTGSGVDPKSVIGVGLSVPGTVDTKNNILEYSPTLKTKNLPLDIMAKYIPYPVMSNNEANLAGFAEIWKIDNIEDAVFLSVNKGVGGAIIIDNKLYNGINGRSGEFGHMTIVKDGLTCSCGKKGCLEAYCSTRVLTDPGFNDVDEFFDALNAGNRICIEKWKTYLDYLATGINNIHTIFDSDIIVGGEISRYLEQYSEMIYQKLLPLNTFDERRNYLHFSKYGSDASAIGAALLWVDMFLSD